MTAGWPRLTWSPEAKADLVRIRERLMEEGEDAWPGVRAYVHERVQLLRTFPRAGRPRPDTRAGLRAVSAARYLIIYRVRGGVEIVRIVHGSQDVGSLLIP